MGGARRQRVFREFVAGFVARCGGDSERTRRRGSSGTLPRTVRQGTEKLYREIVEWIVFSLRHRERIPGQHSGRPARGPVVRGRERVGKHCAAGDARQGAEKYL